MEKVKNNKRIEWIDSLKGAMMLAVIWSHSSANKYIWWILDNCFLYGGVLFPLWIYF